MVPDPCIIPADTCSLSWWRCGQDIARGREKSSDWSSDWSGTGVRDYSHGCLGRCQGVEEEVLVWAEVESGGERLRMELKLRGCAVECGGTSSE